MKIQQSIPLQLQVKSQDEHTSLWFALLKPCNTKYRHSVCWCSQNTRGYTNMHWLRSSQHHISCTLDHDNLHHSCICCTVECFVADLLGSHYAQSPICVNNISWVWICTYKSCNSIVLTNSSHQVWAAILVWFVTTTDHSTTFMNTPWKIFLIHSYCPITVFFTSQQVLQ